MLHTIAVIILLFFAQPSFGATYYVQTTGSASNSGSTDQNSASLSGSAATNVTITVTLDGSPDLTGVITTPGATQSTIFLNGSTVSNKKIFKISAVDNILKTVTVDADPACSAGACGAWAIGGRIVWTPANIEAALGGGDVVIVNDDIASSAGAILTARTSGNNTGGGITIRGPLTGAACAARPVLATSGSGVSVVNSNTQTGWTVRCLEIRQTHVSSGSAIVIDGAGWTVVDNKISDAGGSGIAVTAASGTSIINNEITGTVADGINCSAAVLRAVISNNNIHDIGGDGIEIAATATANIVISNNVIDTATARGIYLSGASTAQSITIPIFGNTVYGSGKSGLEVADADTVVILMNNIFAQNGSAANEYNVEWVAGAAEFFGFHGYNVFYHSNCQGSGTGGPACVSGLIPTTTELTSDPLFANPAGGDFSLGAASPARAAGYPGAFIGGSVGYLDIGAVQAQASAGGAHIIGSGL